jgi:hypothetical protein
VLAHKNMALKRMANLKSKFKKQPGLFKMSCDSMDENVKMGFANKITPEEICPVKGILRWYLPLHCVTHPNKPGKVRVTFDAKAQVKNVLLNDELLTGPDLANRLLGVQKRKSDSPS